MAEEAEKFGARMRERRMELHLTQREVADRVEGKTEGKDISRYERGEHLPGPDTRTAVARALETDVADLYAGPLAERKRGPTPDPFATEPAEEADLAAQVRRTYSEIAELRGELSAVRTALSRVESLLQRDGHGRAETGS